MNQKFRQILSTVQETKLQQLHLEVESLERQLENILNLESSLSGKEVNQLNQLPNFIYLNQTEGNTPIRLTYDASS